MGIEIDFNKKREGEIFKKIRTCSTCKKQIEPNLPIITVGNHDFCSLECYGKVMLME